MPAAGARPHPDFLAVAAIDCGENIWFPPLRKRGHVASPHIGFQDIVMEWSSKEHFLKAGVRDFWAGLLLHAP
jgi:hypothetical protein